MEYFNVSGVVEAEMIKVVHVIIGLNVGGAELMLKRLIESHLTTGGIQHTVISLTSLGVLGPELQRQGVNVYSLNMTTVLKGPVVLFKLRALISKLQPDIVHSWMYHADLLAGVAAFSLGIKNIIWGIRSTDITKGGSKATILIRKICAYLSYKVPQKILCAASVSRDVHINVGYHSSKMEVIPNGFDIARFSNNQKDGMRLREELGVPSDSLAFISVGRYSQVKDHKTFVIAACELLKIREDVCFILVGRDLDKHNTDLIDIIGSAGVESRFYLLGQRSDIPSCLAASDIFCLHSVTEGFPNVLGEAMLTGLPCITTDVGDARYLLNNDDFTIVASNPQLMTEKMNQLADSPKEYRDTLGNNNRRRIVENYSITAVSGQYMTLYNELNGK